MKKLLLMLYLLFFANLCWSQIATTLLKWDKTGCQPNQIDQIIFDNNFSTAGCLQVCQNSVMNYRLIGSDLPNITNVEWTVTGGEIETNHEFALINWDDSNTGSIDIKLTFIDNTVVQRAICIEKMESQLVVSWDKIGCQAEENNISEIKFSNMSLANPSLKVCKDTKPTFSLTGDNATNIQTIQWLVTGGVPETPTDFKTAITWDATNTGYITVRIKYYTGTIVQKSISVNKINSSLLLEWEKIADNTVHEIKLVNTDANKESILVYDDSTVDYTIKGTNKNTIASVQWEVIGGFTANETGFTVPVTWTDDDVKELIVHINYVDGTTADEKFAVLSKAAIGPPTNPNSLNFDYDISGNQKLRTPIYLALKTGRTKEPEIINEDEKKYVESDIYSDVLYYPNPTVEILYVKWENIETVFVENIKVFDLNGRVIREINDLKNTENVEVNFQDFPSGLYELLLSYSDNNSKTLKIIKK